MTGVAALTVSPVDLSHPAPAQPLEGEEGAEVLAGEDVRLARSPHRAARHHSTLAWPGLRPVRTSQAGLSVRQLGNINKEDFIRDFITLFAPAN